MSVFTRVAVAAALLFGIAGMAAGLGLAADVAQRGAAPVQIVGDGAE